MTGSPTPAVHGRVSADAWRRQAACRGYPTDWWFPPHAGNSSENTEADVYARARLVCADCPVRSECLNGALERNEQHGMWGGLALKQRRAIARTRALPARRIVAVCVLCSAGFTATRRDVKFCSRACRERAYYHRKEPA